MRARTLLTATLAGLTALALASGPTRADEPSLERLERRLDELTRRLERLEAQTSAATATSPAPTGATSKDIQWGFDAALSRTPFNVTHQGFERESGHFDLLLKIVAPLPDPGPWQVPVGAPVPVEARVGLADGSSGEGLVFRLARGPRLDVGAVLHLQAEIPADQAGAVQGVALRLR